MASTKVDVPVIHRFGEPHKDIGGRRWYNGCGSESPDIVFVDSWPGDEIKRTNRPLSDRVGRCLQWLLKLADINPGRCYYTYAVKFPFPNGKKPSATDKHLCETMLREELETLNPKVVVAFGSDAWAAVADARKHPFACCRGEPLWFCDMPDDSGSTPKRAYWLFPTFNLPQVMMNGGEAYKDRMALEDIPQHILVHRAVHELKLIKRLADGEDLKATYAAHRPIYDVLTTPEQVATLHAALKTGSPDNLICLDCEWDGKNWLDPNRYIRTVQLGVASGYTAIVKLHEAGGLPVAPDLRPIWLELKSLLEDPQFGIVGHNVISDGEWLLQEGIDIRERVVYDTMLGEYLLCEDGPFGLEEAAMKYAPYGRYCSELECWVKTHGRECKLGFGNVPDDILMPYGAADVDCLRYIMKAQLPMIEKLGYMEPRGTEKQYPSMLQETLNTQKVLYEVEGTGMPVDRDQLNMLIDKFQSKKAELLSQVVLGAANVGMPDFNPGAPAQVKELLFKKLGLPPVKTTAGKDWAEAVGNVGLDEDIEEAPGTDKQTLEILGDRHPLCKSLLQYRRIEQPCKTWLRHVDENNTDRGLEAQLWADGRLHSHMSQLSTTSRFKSSSPNCVTGDVEVLTSLGWMRWDEAYSRRDEGLLLAQWDPSTKDRSVTFAKPDAWHYDEAETVHVTAGKQIDIHCTANHRFMLYHRVTGEQKSVTAGQLEEYPDWMIPQCGQLAESLGTRHLSDAEISLLCATQADSYINHSTYKGVRSVFGVSYDFSKQRKVDRLASALKSLGIAVKVAHGKTSIGTARTRMYIGKKYRDKLFTEFKRFDSKLLDFDVDTLRRIADEVFFWDGCVVNGARRDQPLRYNYASVIPENTGWVQALEALNMRRARGRVYMSKCGNPSYQIDVCSSQFAPLSSVVVQPDIGTRAVYCATMPLGTIVIKSAENVIFSQNSQNFPKKAEGFMTEIFGAGNEPPVVRTIVVPPPGMVMMEADFQQALEGPQSREGLCKRK